MAHKKKAKKTLLRMKHLKVLILALAAMVTMSACSEGPETPDVSFAYSTYSYTEGFDQCYIAVYQMESPYEFPVMVTLRGEVKSGKDNLGRTLQWQDIIEFEVEDAEDSYTVKDIDGKSFTISGVRVTYKEYNKKIYFKSKVNDYLQDETITIEFTITEVSGSTIGSSKSTIVTLVDDEKAPLIKTGFYKTEYTPVAGSQNPTAGSFYLRLYKSDKYEYVAQGWFGRNRPRLVGTFDPLTQTLTFDGTDYDHTVWFSKEGEKENRVNAFENDTIWAFSNSEKVITQVLKMRGAGASGTAPIVIKTDKIEENHSGFLVECTTECGFDIWNYDAALGKVTTKAGTWDGMTNSTKMTHSSTDYEVETQSRGALSDSAHQPHPFVDWTIATIND